MTWPFGELERGAYPVVYADPAWTFAVRSPKGEARSATAHYGCMSLDEIKALPVSDLAATDAVLLLWVTDPLFDRGLEVMTAWGFTFKTVGFHWVKTNRDGSPFTGMGYWTRANPELCLLGTRGSPQRVDKSVQRLLMSPPTIMSARREHSRKPDEVVHRIERLLNGPYVELFARTQRPGWAAWGDEVSKFVDVESVADIQRRFGTPCAYRGDILALLDGTPEADALIG